MPVKSQAQRKFIFATKGANWAKAHHFDNKGKLPMRVSHMPALNKLTRKKNGKNR